MFQNIKLKPLFISLFLSLGTGALASLFTADSREQYATLYKPPFAPPGWLFPVVWTILFILMGVAAYLVYISDSPQKTDALKLYLVHLFVNFSWSIIFFRLEWYLAAFIWLVLLWIAILCTLLLFRKICKAAGWLLVPYLLWVTFAAYLTLAIYILNR